VSPACEPGALLCLPRSLPNPSPRRRGQCGARAAQRARTTLTPTSGDASSATRRAPAAHPRSTGPLRPLQSRRETGTHHRPVAPARNLYPRRKTPALIPPVTHIHAGRPTLRPKPMMLWTPSSTPTDRSCPDLENRRCAFSRSGQRFVSPDGCEDQSRALVEYGVRSRCLAAGHLRQRLSGTVRMPTS
jgi:hypothetical protein